LALSTSSEVVTLEESRDPSSQSKEAAPLAPGESSLQHGNILQTPSERFKDLPEASLAGEADPGYGRVSASRTDLQRAHEANVRKRKAAQIKAALKKLPIPVDDPLEPLDGRDAKNLERHMYRRINEMANPTTATPREISRSQASVQLIKRKAVQIRDKMREAQKLVKDHIKKAEEDAKKENEDTEEESSEKKLTPQEQEQQSIKA